MIEEYSFASFVSFELAWRSLICLFLGDDTESSFFFMKLSSKLELLVEEYGLD